LQKYNRQIVALIFFVHELSAPVVRIAFAHFACIWRKESRKETDWPNDFRSRLVVAHSLFYKSNINGKKDTLATTLLTIS
jgi:hypothetical protein